MSYTYKRKLDGAWITLIGAVVSAPVDTFHMGVTEPVITNSGHRYLPTNEINSSVTLSVGQTFSGNVVKGRINIPQAATGTIIIEDVLVDASASTTTSGLIINIHPNTGAEVIIRHVTIKGTTGTIGVGTRYFHLYRCHIYNVEDGVRCHNYAGTGQAARTVIEGNLIEKLIVRVPDPNQVRDDDRTHSDGIQIEGGDGIIIRGNAIHCTASTDGTSNIEWALNTSPYKSVAAGTANARPHPQGSQVIALTPNVSPITNLTVQDNWFYGGEMGVNAGKSANSTTTALFSGNRYDRGQWHAGYAINVHSTANGIIFSGETYMDDGAPVAVRGRAA